MTEELAKYQPGDESQTVINRLLLQDEWVKSLLQPTPEQFIKQRVVGGGKKADYIEGGIVKGTLLERSHGDFRFQSKLLSQEELDNLERMLGGKLPQGLVLAWGSLDVHTPSGYISSSTDIGAGMLKGVTSQESVEQAIKGALTDAFKRCATYFGVALDLYSPGIYDDPEEKKREDNERKVVLSRLQEILMQINPQRASENLRSFSTLSLEELWNKVKLGEEKLKEKNNG